MKPFFTEEDCQSRSHSDGDEVYTSYYLSLNAANARVAPLLPKCVCGTNSLNTIHRDDGPCYQGQGIACETHDLHSNVKCGICFDALKEENERLTEQVRVLLSQQEEQRLGEAAELIGQEHRIGGQLEKAEMRIANLEEALEYFANYGDNRPEHVSIRVTAMGVLGRGPLASTALGEKE